MRALSLLVLVLLSGCGQKGPLYFAEPAPPPQPQDQPSTPEQAPAEDQDDDSDQDPH
ncbi:hypothetical protein A6D6_02216 [Alcanivorax xiamenensis]|uniref:Lipoprotein n=2 Tax=Alcanivoracaceae TaxID=224372 RepID=A0A9Q3W4A8_9GAMM|nr:MULTISPECIES: lipoprotein [Alcanivoracaceae]KAF0805575.1 hypothetical protein A6D6_02216 [Alcanivorax xiamenensis]MCE7508341.1 lipoprotein [Alloalcanivorax xenomutans]